MYAYRNTKIPVYPYGKGGNLIKTANGKSDTGPDQVFIEVHGAGQAGNFNILIEPVHALHLLRSVDDRGEAENVVTDFLVEPSTTRQTVWKASPERSAEAV